MERVKKVDWFNFPEYRGVYLDPDGDVVFMYPQGGKYEILKTQCDSLPKILRWVMHMSEKNWVTTQAIRVFISLAMQTNNMGTPYKPK